MQKKFVGTLDGTLVFWCDNVSDPSFAAGLSGDRGVECPNCKMMYTLHHVKRSGYVSGLGLVAMVERLHVNGDCSKINHAGLALLPTLLDGIHGSILPNTNKFIDNTPILQMFGVGSTNIISSVDLIGGLVHESTDAIVQHQIRYRIVRIGFMNGWYCKECDALLVGDPVIYGDHVQQSFRMNAGCGISGLLSNHKLYLFDTTGLQYEYTDPSSPRKFIEKCKGKKLLYSSGIFGPAELNNIEWDENGVLIGRVRNSSTVLNGITASSVHELRHVLNVGKSSDCLIKPSELLDLIRTLGVSLTEENYGIGVIER